MVRRLLPPTRRPRDQRGFYQATNAWWVARKAEVDGDRPPHPLANLIEVGDRRLAWARSRDREDLAQAVQEEITRIEADDAGGVFDRKSPWDVPDMIIGTIQDAIWSGRPPRQEESSDPDRSMRYHAALRLEELEESVESGQFGAGEHQGRTYHSKHFVAHFGEEARIVAIDEGLWASFHRFPICEMNRGRQTAIYAEKLHRSARTLIEHHWLGEEDRRPRAPARQEDAIDDPDPGRPERVWPSAACPSSWA